MALTFITLPEELLPTGEIATKVLNERGFKVKIEESTLEYPSTPTICAKRGVSTHFIFVVDRFDRPELESWISFCRSCDEDVRIALYTPKLENLGMRCLKFCQKWGIGIYTLEGDDFKMMVNEIDLAFQGELPDRKSLGTPTQRLLGSAYDEYSRGNWREGFGKAVEVLEEQSRKYLRKEAKGGMCKYQAGKKVKILAASEVNKMSLGAIKDVVCGITPQNSLNANLCSALRKLNPTRIAKVHNPNSTATEKNLRKRVGRDMWLIVNMVKQLVAT